MKKLILALLVVALAIPAMAADISLTDNGDGTGTIVLTVTGTEVVRGLAIVVAADADVTAVAGTDAIFNVFMDAAYDAELAVPGSYALGTGSPVANPAAVGGIALPAASISLCMGVLDQAGLQGGAAVGTYNVATITTGAATVTITADTLRGGIVGDTLVTPDITGGTITMGGPAPCRDRLTAAEQTVWDAYVTQSTRSTIVTDLESWCNQYQCRGDGANDVYYPQYASMNYAIYSTDLNMLIANWKAHPDTANPAADFAHDTYYPQYASMNYAVYSTDLNILIANWKAHPADLTDCPGYVAP